MSFSRSQQGKYRPLVASAWAEHCRLNDVDLKSHTKDAWYIKQLTMGTGKSSTTACNNSRDYDKAMAHFEMIAHAGIDWQLKLLQGDLGRIRWSVKKINPNFSVTEPWLRGIAKNITGSAHPPQLQDLTNSQLASVTAAACRSAKYAKKDP